MCTEQPCLLRHSYDSVIVAFCEDHAIKQHMPTKEIHLWRSQSKFLAFVGVSPCTTNPVSAGLAWNARHPQHDKILAWEQCEVFRVRKARRIAISARKCGTAKLVKSARVWLRAFYEFASYFTTCRNILCHAWVVSDEVNIMCGTCRQYVDAI
jgi:hypothetical protein